MTDLTASLPSQTDNKNDSSQTPHATLSASSMAAFISPFIQCQAFKALPLTTQTSLGQAKRVLLIANNPSISPQTLAALLQPNDMLVLFNHFIHGDYFATNALAKTLPKLLFFRQIGDSCLHFGLPPRHNNLPFIEQMLTAANVGFLFTNIGYQFPSLADDASPDDDPIDAQVQLTVPDDLRARFTEPATSAVLCEQHPVVADYPIFEDIHSSSPSSGFLMYRLLRAVRAHLQDTYKQQLEIVLLGFNTDDNTNYFWQGHNWAFERQEMANLPDGIRLIQQY